VIRGVSAPRREPARPDARRGKGDRVQSELAMLTSQQMPRSSHVIEQAARADVTVLVCGENVGKELVARAIHAHSRGGDPPRQW